MDNHNVEVGRIKKRFVFRPFRKRVVKKLPNPTKFSRKTAILSLLLLTVFIFGGKELLSQIGSTFQNYYVLANSNVQAPSVNTSNTLEIEDNLHAKVDIQGTRINSNVLTLDKRSYILDLYFLRNNSPLYGTGKLFVEACDKYGAPRDCLTAVAIARNETNLCKYNNSGEMHNCWGFGGSGPNRIKFNSFEESIDRVMKTLVFNYGTKYIIDPSLMEGTFCGVDPSCAGWGKKIKYFINQIDDFGKKEGLGSLLEMR